MQRINLTEGGHSWNKNNLVTQQDKQGHYDQMTCSGCGIKGKVRNLRDIEIADTYATEKILQCPAAKPPEIPSRIKITSCTAVGRIFENLTPNSEHDVIDPPKGEKGNDYYGVWVMGVGEPVKVLRKEYEPVKLKGVAAVKNALKNI